MVAERVGDSKPFPYQEGAARPAGLRRLHQFWASEGSRTERGTDVILYVNQDSNEFLEEHRLRDILEIRLFSPVPFSSEPAKNPVP